MAHSCRLTAERVATLRATPAKRYLVWRFSASVGDLAKSKTKEKGKDRAPQYIYAARLSLIGKPAETGRQGPHWRDNENRTIWYNGDIKKTRQQVRPECSELIYQIISDRRLFDKQYEG